MANRKAHNSVLLIIAAGPLQLPAFEEARRTGIRIATVDANAAAPGMRLADVAYQIDIKDVGAVTEVARRVGATGVLSICTEFGVKTVAAVANALGLPGVSEEAARRATDKRLMRQAFAEFGAPSPFFFEVESQATALEVAGKLGYPVALKIATSSGSRGVYRVENAEQLSESLAAARQYQPEGTVLVEEWLDGPEVSVEGISFGGDIHIIQITDKCVFPGPFPVESGHTQPSRLTDSVQISIRQCAIAGVRALGLTNCAFHAEIKATGHGPKLIEIGARLGGDRISTHLTPLSTGVNLVKAAVQVAMGLTPELTPRVSRGAAIRYFSSDAHGVVKTVTGIDTIQAMDGLELLFAASERDGLLGEGLRIGPIRSSLDRYGHVVFSGKDAAEAAERAEHAVRALRFTFA